MKATPEKINNGGFDDASAWTTQSGWSISAGVASATATTNYLYQSPSPPLGSGIFRVTYTILNYSSGTVRVTLGANVGAIRSANGTYVEFISAGGESVQFFGVSAFTGDIDNVSVQRVQAEASPGTELVGNGGFDNASVWNLASNWSIAGGVASADGSTAGNADQQLWPGGNPNAGATYRTVFTVLNYSQGNVRLLLGTTGVGTNRSANGTYTEDIVGGAGSFCVIDAGGGPNFNGDVDNVSVKTIKAIIK